MRALDPIWVDLLAEEIGRDGQTVPIRVVARGEGFVLIDGARRVAAVAKLGRATVEARIEPEEALADTAFVRLGEIKGNFLRSGLSVLERAYVFAAWREVYESVQTPKKRGRRPNAEMSVILRNNSPEGRGSPGDAFALRFSEAARQALKVGKDDIYRALTIARIVPAQGHRLTGHPTADSQSQLLLLAAQTSKRQAAIIDLLRGDGPKAATVREAIDLLDGTASLGDLSPSERATQSLARLSPEDQFAFFDLCADDIGQWMDKRAAKVPLRVVH